MPTIARLGCVLALFACLVPSRVGAAEPREIIAKAIAAHGGADTIRKFKGNLVKTKGKYYTLGVAVDFLGETTIQMPDRILQKVEFNANGLKTSFVRILIGDHGWQSFNGLTADLNRAMIAEAQEQLYAQSVERLIPLLDSSYKLSSLGESTLDGRPVLGICVEREKHRPINLFFDRESYLLRKSETRSKDPMAGNKEFLTAKIYDDYKKVKGLMAAWKITVLCDGKEFLDSEVTDVEFSEKLDDRHFAKP